MDDRFISLGSARAGTTRRAVACVVVALGWMLGGRVAARESPPGPPETAAPAQRAAEPEVVEPEAEVALRPATLVLLQDPARLVRAEASLAVATHLAVVGFALDLVSYPLPREPDTSWPDAAWIDALVVARAPRGARAIAWLRSTGVGGRGPGLELYVYACDERTLGRRGIESVAAGPAGDETIALVLKSIAAALADGSPTGLEPVTLARGLPPPAAPSSPPPASPRAGPRPPAHALRVGIGYAGTHYAANVVWQSGVHIGAGWRLPAGVDVSAAYTWFPPARADRGASQIVVQRRPLELAVGYAHRWGRVELGGHVAVLTDPARRRSSTDDPALRALAPATRWLFAIAPRLRVDVTLARSFGWWALVGAEIWLNPTDYGVGAPARQIVIAPSRVRPTVVTGPRVRFDLRRRN